MINQYFYESAERFLGYVGYFFGRDFNSSFYGLIVGIPLLIWFLISLALSGYALWTAAKRNEKWWFIIFIVIHTAGILEIIYLLFVAKVSFGRRVEKKHEDHNQEHVEN